MNPSRDRAILQISAAVIFLLSIITLLSAAPNIALNPGLYPAIIYFAMGSFNATILLSWVALGISGGITFTILALLVVVLAGARLGYPVAASALSFPLISVIGYLWFRKIRSMEQMSGLKAEKIDEEANLVSDSIKKRKAEIDSLRKKIERYAALKEVAEALSTTLSLNEIESLVIDSAMRVVGRADRALFFLVDRDRQELALSASRVGGVRQNIKSKKGDIFDNWVLKQRKTLIIEDAASDFRFPAENLGPAKNAFRSMISAPLVMEGKIIGVLRLDCLKELSYVQEDLRLLGVIADLAAVAVENNRLYARTEELAIKDGLTDLVVPRYFRERLSEEALRSARTKSAFSLLMLDIDYFKNYNDRYGHIVGDIVLRYLAGILKKAARDVDIVARYGGEEFALILIGRDKSAAMGEAEAIRKKIESEPLVLRREKTLLTVSIGVASFPGDTLVAEDLIKQADGNLYKAKAAGRNRVFG